MRLIILVIFGVAGCSTGFGEPCEVPRAESFQNACFSPDIQDDETESDVEQQTVSSCAIKNYAGCSTRVCLVYRGSDAFCSEPCKTDGDCEGSAICAPMYGEPSGSNECNGECYCVRQGDL